MMLPPTSPISTGLGGAYYAAKIGKAHLGTHAKHDKLNQRCDEYRSGGAIADA
jgi:hypothetical protein